MNKNQIVCILKMEYLAVLGNVCLSDSQEQFCSIFCPVNLILELDISSYTCTFFILWNHYHWWGSCKLEVHALFEIREKENWTYFGIKKTVWKLSMMVQAFDPSTWKRGAGRSLWFQGQLWSTPVPSQPGWKSQTLSRKKEWEVGENV